MASIGVKLFVLYLIMGVGMGIAARWGPVLSRGGFSPIPFFYVMGGSLVFLFLTWHIPSVAGAMIAGAVHLSLADVYYPTMLASRAGAAGLATAGALFALGRSGHDRLREWSALHTRGDRGAGGSGGSGGSPVSPGGDPRGPGAGPAAQSFSVRTADGPRAEAGASVTAREPAPGSLHKSNIKAANNEPTTPPNATVPFSESSGR